MRDPDRCALKSPGSPQRFLAIHATVYDTFNLQRPYYVTPHALPLQSEHNEVMARGSGRSKTLPCDQELIWRPDADDVHVLPEAVGTGDTKDSELDVKKTA
jgi:hypothetical protein